MSSRPTSGADRLRVLRMWRNELRLRRTAGFRRPAAGIDEAGRGPLAGPVVAAAVILPRLTYIPGLDDSKRVRPGERARIASVIKEIARDWSIAIVSVETIDTINILQASRLAICRAFEGLRSPGERIAMVDGLPVPGLGEGQLAVKGGDRLCPSIAAASIIAKVTRDGIMAELDQEYPHYGFAQNKGYATPQHLRALRHHGPSPVHRKSFSWRGDDLFPSLGREC